MEHSISISGKTITKGSLFRSVWGSEQTNVCFYEVLAVKGQLTLVLSRIRARKVALGDMHGKAFPAPGEYEGEPFTRRIKSLDQRPYVAIEDYEKARLVDLEEAAQGTDFSTWG